MPIGAALRFANVWHLVWVLSHSTATTVSLASSSCISYRGYPKAWWGTPFKMGLKIFGLPESEWVACTCGSERSILECVRHASTRKPHNPPHLGGLNNTQTPFRGAKTTLVPHPPKGGGGGGGVKQAARAAGEGDKGMGARVRV